MSAAELAHSHVISYSAPTIDVELDACHGADAETLTFLTVELRTPLGDARARFGLRAADVRILSDALAAVAAEAERAGVIAPALPLRPMGAR